MRVKNIVLCFLLLLVIGCLGCSPQRPTMNGASSSPISDLKSDSEESRFQAARALFKFDLLSPRCISALTEALNDESPRVRAIAAITLARQAPDEESLLPVLREMLTSSDESIRTQAACSLALLGRKSKGRAKAAVPDLIRAVSDDSPFVRRESVIALEAIGPDAKDAVPTLIEALDNPNDNTDVPLFSAEALGSIGSGARNAVPALVRTLKQASWEEMKPAAAKALGEIGVRNDDVLSALRDSLSNPSAPLVSASVGALQKLRDEDEFTIRTLNNLLKHPAGQVRRSAVSALASAARRSDSALGALVNGLDIEDVRIQAAEVLGGLGHRANAAIPALRNAAKADDPAFQAAASAAIGRIEGATGDVDAGERGRKGSGVNPD